MDNYTSSNLTKDERVIYEAKYHWIIFISFKALFTLWTSPLIEFFTNEFIITNKRVIMKVGLISRQTMELNISKIESVNVNQGVIGRILGYGDISILGSGSSRTTFKKISNPIAFRKALQEII